MSNASNNSDAEIRLMGLILSQSALVGLAIGLFDAGMWLNSNDAMVNGFTYAMAAFFVQGIAYYFFKMFFEQNMQERVRTTGMQRSRDARYKQMQMNFDNRRVEMEMRMQEAQLERELRWMEANPGKMPPSWGVQGGSQSMVGAFDSMGGGANTFDASSIPTHQAKVQQPLTLGINDDDDVPRKKDGTPDKRHKSKN